MARGPISVATVGALAAGSVGFRIRGKVYVTVIAKAAFDLRSDADMTPANPDGLLEAEYRRSPNGSVRATSELAPYLPAADVMFTGHAHVPGRTKATQLDVRLAVWREHTLVDKTLRVQTQEAFTQFPLVYERAYGGPGFAPNPLGTGYGGNRAPPAITQPGAPPDTPAGFGPISADWAARKGLLKSRDAAFLRRPVVELPDDFEWSYFLASPADQRAPYLAGDEWILLENMLANDAHLRSRLPDVRGLARMTWSPGGEPDAPAPLSADTLRIDGEARRAHVVFRAAFPLPDGARIDQARAAVALSIRGEPVDWARAAARGPASFSPLDTTINLAPRAPAGADGTFGTTADFDTAPRAEPLPFASAPASAKAPPTSAPSSAGTPWSGAPAKPVPRVSSSLASTFILDEEPARDPAPRTSPAVRAPADIGGTIDFDALPPVGADPLPFQSAPASAKAPPPSSSPQGHTPWSGPAAKSVPRPSSSAATTFVFDDEPTAAPPTPSASSEAKIPDEDLAPPVPPKRPAPAPAPPPPRGPTAILTSVKKGGYDRFKR
jgi:hypothetical protein